MECAGDAKADKTASSMVRREESQHPVLLYRAHPQVLHACPLVPILTAGIRPSETSKLLPERGMLLRMVAGSLLRAVSRRPVFHMQMPQTNCSVPMVAALIHQVLDSTDWLECRACAPCRPPRRHGPPLPPLLHQCARSAAAPAGPAAWRRRLPPPPPARRCCARLAARCALRRPRLMPRLSSTRQR
jgi:hypothetical protein